MTADASARISRRAHRQSVEIADADLVNALVDKLGTNLVAFIIERDKSTISRMKAGSAALPDDVATKMRLVYQVFQLLESHEADHTIRAWFIGMNPQLDDDSPAEAVQQGKLKDVLVAARAFLAGG